MQKLIEKQDIFSVLQGLTAVSGHGQFHTANPNSKNPKPYINDVSWENLLNMVKNPGSIPKEKAQWAIFSTATGEQARVHDFQRQHGKFFCAWGDIDGVSGLTVLDVVNRVQSALPGIHHIIYSSRSAREDLPKTRILIPFAYIVQGADYSMIQKILSDRLEASGLLPDRATERPGQLCYLPNKGEFYQFQINDGPLLDPYQAFESEIIAEQARLKTEQINRQKRHKEAIEKAQDRIITGQVDPVEAYRQNYPLELALEMYGYTRRGNKWMSPKSESGKPGVTVKNSKWYSHHSNDSAIGQPGRNGGTWGDSFDLFVYFEHAGDVNRAVKAAGELFTTTDQVTGQRVSITKANQRQHMREQATHQKVTEQACELSLDGAIATMDNAIGKQETDPGSLYEDSVMDAYNFMKKESAQYAMRYRVLISACKNIQITKFEHAAAVRQNQKKYGEAGKPEKVIDFFNKIHAGVMVGSQFRVLEEIKDSKGRPDIRILSVPDFFNRYSNKWMPDPVDPAKLMPAAHFWMKDAKRRDYMGGINFMPKGCPDNVFNLYKGFAVKPRHGKWNLLKRHVYEVLVSGNQKHGDYFLAWLAKILQTPWEKNTTCPVFISGQGAGKNSFIESFGKILGQHFKTITNERGLSGQFNGHMKDCLLLFANEAIWGGDRQGAGQIKSIITDPTLRVELKGKDSFEVDNYINLIVASNSDRAIPAEIGDRRFYVMNVSNHRKDDTEYFAALHTEIETGGIQAMMHDLLKLDISGVNLRQIERTDGLMGQILKNMQSVDSYWFHRLRDGYLLPAKYDDEGHETREAYPWEQPVISALQYNDYLSFCAQRQIKYPDVDQTFGKYFSRLYPGMPKPSLQKVIGYSHRVKCRRFLSLDICREVFSRAVLGIDVETAFKEDE